MNHMNCMQAPTILWAFLYNSRNPPGAEEETMNRGSIIFPPNPSYHRIVGALLFICLIYKPASPGRLLALLF